MGSGPEFLNVEKPLLDQLGEMGWKTIAGSLDFPSVTGRASFRDVILKSDLAAALRRVNLRDGEPWLDDGRVSQAVSGAARRVALGRSPDSGFRVPTMRQRPSSSRRQTVSPPPRICTVGGRRLSLVSAVAGREGHRLPVYSASCRKWGTSLVPLLCKLAPSRFRLIPGRAPHFQRRPLRPPDAAPHPRLDGGHRPHAGARHRRDHGDLLRRPCSGPGARRARRRPRRRLGRLGRTSAAVAGPGRPATRRGRGRERSGARVRGGPVRPYRPALRAGASVALVGRARP